MCLHWGMTNQIASISGKADRAGRLSADDWSAAALQQIGEQGVPALAVEPLARRLGVTKGSFYWHFPTRDALLQAALDRWEQYEQAQVFDRLESIDDPRARLEQLFQLVAHDDVSHVIYGQLLRAMDNPIVQPAVTRISRRRLEWVTDSFRRAGFDADTARYRARLVYSAYIGFLQLNLQLPQDRPPKEEYEAYVAHMMATLIPKQG